MTDWMDDYLATNDRNDRYRLLCREATRLRNGADGSDLYDPEAVGETVRALDQRVAGDLVVFVANDFGLPRAFRPDHAQIGIQDAVRRAILDNKYDDSNPDLDELREDLLAEHPRVHKAIVAEVQDSTIRYHLPEGSNQTTNFLTVRQMLGLVDYTTNSFGGDGRSRTY